MYCSSLFCIRDKNILHWNPFQTHLLCFCNHWDQWQIKMKSCLWRTLKWISHACGLPQILLSPFAALFLARLCVCVCVHAHMYELEKHCVLMTNTWGDHLFLKFVYRFSFVSFTFLTHLRWKSEIMFVIFKFKQCKYCIESLVTWKGGWLCTLSFLFLCLNIPT